MMRHALATLLLNLAAGSRLALFRPVGITSFRITLGALLGLIAFLYALDIALDALRVGADASFDVGALPRAAFGTIVMLLLIAMFAIVFRQPHLMLALSVTILAAVPLLDIAGQGYHAFVDRVDRWTPTVGWIAWAAWIAVAGWGVAIIARAVAITLSPRPRHFRLAVFASTALMFAVGMLVEWRFPEPDWWIGARAQREDRGNAWSIVSEQALVRQPQLLAESLRDLEPQRPGIVDLYFVGFAPYASQDVFLKDVAAARGAVSERFETAKRSVELVSNPRMVLEKPIASGSNLRATLQAVGERIDRDEDVVLLFVTSHGGQDHRLSVEFFPLRLDALNAADLRSMLDDAGIRWRIVVISACYSGGFIPALADERTLVMTAAAADRTSFGCSHDSDMTFFTDALFNQALRSERSLLGAFERARTLVAERERAEGMSPPSDPQISVGAAMREKLLALESRSPAAACAAGPC
jgi:Peptidase C13 family